MNMRKCHHFLWQYVSIIKEEHKHTSTHTHSHCHPDKKLTLGPLCNPIWSHRRSVVRSLLSLHSLSQHCLWTQLPRKCNTACLFLWLSGMIRNIIMIKLAGGEELSGSRRPRRKARKRLEYCQRVVNKRAEVCECVKFLRVFEYVYTSAHKYEFLS